MPRSIRESLESQPLSGLVLDLATELVGRPRLAETDALLLGRVQRVDLWPALFVVAVLPGRYLSVAASQVAASVGRLHCAGCRGAAPFRRSRGRPLIGIPLLAINFKRSWVSMLSLSDPHIPKDELWRNRRDHLAAKHEAIIGESDKHRAERARPIEADVTMTRGNLP
jgi:hypothetical protein